MRPQSRGHIELCDNNPSSPPRILANYLKDPRDRVLMHKGIRLIRELVKQPAFTELCGEEIFPGEAVQSDAQLDTSLNSHVYTQWHLSGTARMGSKNDNGAVVDIEGRVHGLHGLRVVDASIMPSVTNGNTNAPTIMIAEKLSDAILGNTPLPRNEAEVLQSKNFYNSQR